MRPHRRYASRPKMQQNPKVCTFQTVRIAGFRGARIDESLLRWCSERNVVEANLYAGRHDLSPVGILQYCFGGSDPGDEGRMLSIVALRNRASSFGQQLLDGLLEVWQL